MPSQIKIAANKVFSGEEPWPLFMGGPPGIGKTRAALFMLDNVHAPHMYWSLPDLCSEIVEAQQGRKHLERIGGSIVYTEKMMWDEIEKANLVVLDDIGERKQVSDHHFLVFKRVLDIRECQPLVLISNLWIDDISKLYDDKIASRCAAGLVIPPSDLEFLPDQRIA